MIQTHRADQRQHECGSNHDRWLTLGPSVMPIRSKLELGGFESLSESRLEPLSEASRIESEGGEVLSYVSEGALAHEDSSGDSGILFAGDFLRRTVGRELRLEETNTSRSYVARIFRVRLRASVPSLEDSQEQRRFSSAQRRGGLCLVASPDGRQESLHLGQDVFIYSALLDPGQHLALEISSIRSIWLHVVRGVLSLRDLVISQGDSVFLIEELALSLRALEKSEILLLDLVSDRASLDVVSSVSSLYSESEEGFLQSQVGETGGNGRIHTPCSTVGRTLEGGQ